MQEPTPRASRLALAGGLAAAILFGGGGFLLGRSTTERDVVIERVPVAAPTPSPQAPEATAQTTLARADLIALSATAADAAASGRDPGAAIAAADGRRFEIRIPFGCDGPADADSGAAMRWNYDEADQALRVHVAPVAWAAGDWWTGAPPGGVDAVEGFWIMRPWSSAEACPAGNRGAATGTEPVTLPGQTLALGQVFSGEGARAGRRDGQPYETVLRVARDELDLTQGLRLRLSGRITALPGGGPVRCRQPAGAEQRPICLIGVELDEVAIENPTAATALATWDSRRTNAGE